MRANTRIEALKMSTAEKHAFSLCGIQKCHRTPRESHALNPAVLYFRMSHYDRCGSAVPGGHIGGFRFGTHAARIQDHHAGDGGHHPQQGFRLCAGHDPGQLLWHGHRQRRLRFRLQPVLSAGAAVQFLHLRHADPPVRAGAGAARPGPLQPLCQQHHQPVRAGSAGHRGAAVRAGPAAGGADLRGLRRGKGRAHGAADPHHAAVAGIQCHLHQRGEPAERLRQIRRRAADRLPAERVRDPGVHGVFGALRHHCRGLACSPPTCCSC